MRCKTCHYSLAGLTENRCPECGREFDPNDPSTFLTHTDKARLGWRVCLAIAAMSYVAAFFFLLPMGRYPVANHDSSRLLILIDVAGWALVIWPFVFLLLLVAWIVLRGTITTLTRTCLRGES